MIEARYLASEGMVARFYDDKARSHGSAAFDAGRDYMIPWLQRVGVGPGKKVLDAGCGPGHWVRCAVDLGAEVVGLDISSEMVRLASKLVPESKFFVESMDRVPFGDDYFDIVISCGSMEHSTDIARSRNELYRVCKDRSGFILPMPFDGCWKYLEDEELPNMERFGDAEDWRNLLLTPQVRLVEEWIVAGPHPDYCAVMQKAEG